MTNNFVRQPVKGVPSIFVAIPSGKSGWAPDFTMSLYDVITRPYAEAMGWPSEPDIRWAYCRSSNLLQNRHDLVTKAQKSGSTHILWLDDDMTFPADTLERLLKADKDIIACNCTTRALPIFPTAVKDGKRLRSIDNTGITTVDGVGLAVCLMKIDVFNKMKKPWFMFNWDDEYNGKYISEDHYLFRKARALGYQIYIDHDLSKQIGHLGEMEFSHPMTEVPPPE